MSWYDLLKNGTDVPDNNESFGTDVSEYQQGGILGTNAERDASPGFWKSHTEGNAKVREVLEQARKAREKH